ncbi:MAG: alpha/beta fold hydrolase [Armatimonadetes bacterium]|nr:alpha/beta fold hydrolase [Armatimonadota bacterium]MDW8122054.1 alpha/beta fold hydrolase [Armatimonadota bacterium]
MVEEFAWIPSRGRRMAGMVHKPTLDGRFPTVVMLHGFTGNRIEPHRLFVKAARRWVSKAGLAVLRFDFVGSGESEGDFSEVTPATEIEDALNALEWVRQQPFAEPERLALVGLSLGGFVAACTAARDGKVKALVLWAAAATSGELWDRLLDENLKKTLQEQGYLDWQGWKVTESFVAEARRIDPLREMLRYDGATLIVHGTEDAAVPVDHAHRYHSVAREPKSLHLIKDADHTFARLDWEEEVFTVTEEWLVRYL